jgi:hypothetical protein
VSQGLDLPDDGFLLAVVDIGVHRVDGWQPLAHVLLRQPEDVPKDGVVRQDPSVIQRLLKRIDRHCRKCEQSCIAPRSCAHGGTGSEHLGPPNILFICMDQLRSLMDVPQRLPLPCLRRFQRESRTFRNYHVHQAPCGPSRATFYTGQHTQKTGMYTNPVGEFGTYSRMRRAASSCPSGFPPSERFGHDGVTAAEAVNLLERFAAGGTGGKRWFLAVNFVNPHDIMFFDARGQATPLVGAPTLGAPEAQLRVQSDPDELVNLACRPEEHRVRILELNTKVNTLIDTEIGADDGAMYPGPKGRYSLG